MLVSRRLKRLLRLVPGRERLGAYRLLPFFFVLGGAMEWFMINVRIGKETFCEWGRRGRSRNAALAARGRWGCACPGRGGLRAVGASGQPALGAAVGRRL